MQAGRLDITRDAIQGEWRGGNRGAFWTIPSASLLFCSRKKHPDSFSILLGLARTRLISLVQAFTYRTGKPLLLATMKPILDRTRRGAQ